MQSTCHHCLSETDPEFADWADAVAVLASLRYVTVGAAEQESVERRAGSPKWLGLYFGIEVEMCQTRKEIRYQDDATKLARFRLIPNPENVGSRDSKT